jgi:hypothetical protein
LFFDALLQMALEEVWEVRIVTDGMKVDLAHFLPSGWAFAPKRCAMPSATRV